MLRRRGIGVACPERTYGTVDHIIPTLDQARPFADDLDPLKVRRITVSGELGRGVYAKDVILEIIARLGVRGGVGYRRFRAREGLVAPGGLGRGRGLRRCRGDRRRRDRAARHLGHQPGPVGWRVGADSLKALTFDGLGAQVFQDDRGSMPGHPFANPSYAGASILLANEKGQTRDTDGAQRPRALHHSGRPHHATLHSHRSARLAPHGAMGRHGPFCSASSRTCVGSRPDFRTSRGSEPPTARLGTHLRSIQWPRID